MQIKHWLNAVYKDSAPSFTTVKWTTEIKRGCTSLANDEHFPGSVGTI